MSVPSDLIDDAVPHCPQCQLSLLEPAGSEERPYWWCPGCGYTSVALRDVAAEAEADGHAQEWIVPSEGGGVRGDEPFNGLDARVLDFWRFALGDLRMNNARGYLAEFIVAKALGLPEARRIEWAEYYVLFEGIRIEVKSGAYLQAWEQRKLSRIAFSGLKGTPYSPRDGYDPAGKQFNADVYVFCAQTAMRHEDYDVLDVRQWEFYVLPRRVLEQRGYESISLTTLRGLVDAVSIGALQTAVKIAARS